MTIEKSTVRQPCPTAGEVTRFTVRTAAGMSVLR